MMVEDESRDDPSSPINFGEEYGHYSFSLYSHSITRTSPIDESHSHPLRHLRDVEVPPATSIISYVSLADYNVVVNQDINKAVRAVRIAILRSLVDEEGRGGGRRQCSICQSPAFRVSTCPWIDGPYSIVDSYPVCMTCFEREAIRSIKTGECHCCHDLEYLPPFVAARRCECVYCPFIGGRVKDKTRCEAYHQRVLRALKHKHGILGHQYTRKDLWAMQDRFKASRHRGNSCHDASRRLLSLIRNAIERGESSIPAELVAAIAKAVGEEHP